MCFFDNPADREFIKNEVISFKNWLGGRDLVTNGGGVCTDCHAGENPYVVHPEKDPFAAVVDKLKSPIWYDPLVDASWPQNLGPNNILSGIPSPGKCSSCHTQNGAGRFPIVAAPDNQYCIAVLKNSIGNPNAAKRTMPMGGGDLK